MKGLEPKIIGGIEHALSCECHCNIFFSFFRSACYCNLFKISDLMPSGIETGFILYCVGHPCPAYSPFGIFDPCSPCYFISVVLSANSPIITILGLPMHSSCE